MCNLTAKCSFLIKYDIVIVLLDGTSFIFILTTVPCMDWQRPPGTVSLKFNHSESFKTLKSSTDMDNIHNYLCVLRHFIS